MRLQQKNMALEKELKKKEREKARNKVHQSPLASKKLAEGESIPLNRDSLLYQLDKLKSMHAWRVRSFKRTIERYDLQIKDCRAQTKTAEAQTERVREQIRAIEEEIKDMEMTIKKLSKIAKKKRES